MPLFKEKKCVCGFDTVGAEIEPNPVGEFFCLRCGRELIPVSPEKGEVEPPKGEPGAEPETEPES